MKRLILASLLLATPALAQQPQYTPLNVTLLHQAESCEMVASAQITAMSAQIATLTKQAETDKKQIGDLTAKVAAQTPPPSAPDTTPGAPAAANPK